jgi:hypothetical protein
MPGEQASKQRGSAKRKPVLSPDINEFLHMLKSLESELATQQAGAR